MATLLLVVTLMLALASHAVVPARAFTLAVEQPWAESSGFMHWEGHKTWYRVVGQITPGKGPLPVVCAHGGPGATFHYLDRMKYLHRDGRAVIHYDQLGCGNSDHLPNAPSEFWTPALFLRELEELTHHLGIADAYHLIGQSWGAMLALQFATQNPPGLKGLVPADGVADIPHFIKELDRLKSELPPDVLATILKYEALEEFDNPEYLAASQVFYDRHVCRVQPTPPEVALSFELMAEDPTVYNAMQGPNEFTFTGTLRDWSIVAQLSNISMPVLQVSGKYDETTPAVQQIIHHHIPQSEWVLFEESSHLPHVEETERWLDVVGAFLQEVDNSVAVQKT